LKRRVVITGVGPITPIGIGKDEFWGNLIAGKSGIGLITQFDASDPGFTTKIAGEVKDFDFANYGDKKEPKYAAYRATNQSRIMGDCTGSKKQYSFRLTAENTGEVHLFECAIDLLSYATLMKLEGKDWRQFNLVSLAGVYSPKQKIENSKVPVTLGRLLEKDKTIRRIVLHLDNDIAGRKATKALQTILSDKYEVVDDPPQYGKDVNDFLCKRLGIKDKTERSFAR